MLYNQFIFSNNLQSRNNFDFFDDIVLSDCCNIVRTDEDLKVLNSPSFKEWLKLSKFLVFGTGGSSLAGQAIYSTLSNPKKEINFVNNLDPSTLLNIFSRIDFEHTGFLFISKSGETLETIVQLLLLMDKIKKFDNLKNRILIITEDKDSTLKEIAKQNGFICFNHPKNIGGRYSVFSLVGMIPAVICGLDPYKIRMGGRQVLDNFGNSIYKVKEGANFVFQNYSQHISNHVTFIYSDKLVTFGYWLAQLYAESSGKNNKGITPLTAIGSIDQHSQLQLYIDGIKDKCFTFLYEKQENTPLISYIDIPENFYYLKNKKISTIFQSQCNATIQTLLENKINIRKIEIPPINTLSLGALFMHFILEVISVCKLMNVDPFNQPAVEKGKVITKNILSNRNDFKI